MLGPVKYHMRLFDSEKLLHELTVHCSKTGSWNTLGMGLTKNPPSAFIGVSDFHSGSGAMPRISPVGIM